MTYRELLAHEHPTCIDGECRGGCHGCPEGYGYETPEESIDVCWKLDCGECWSREIPEKRTAEAATPDGSNS